MYGLHTFITEKALFFLKYSGFTEPPMPDPQLKATLANLLNEELETGTITFPEEA